MSEGGGPVPVGPGAIPPLIEAIDKLIGGGGVFGTIPPGETNVIISPEGIPIPQGRTFGDPFIGLEGATLSPEVLARLGESGIVGVLGPGGIEAPPIAVTQFPVEPPIAVTQFPTVEARPDIAQTPDVGGLLDTFGTIFDTVIQSAVDLAPDVFSLLNLFGIGGTGATGAIPATAGTIPGTSVPAGPISPTSAPTSEDEEKVGFLDTALTTLEDVVRIASLGAPAAQQLGFLPSPGQTPGFTGATTVSAPIALPGGARTAGLEIPFVDVVPQGTTCIRPRPVGSFRLPSRVDVPVPMKDGTVRFTTFKNMGRPILWSGDLAACKRVRRVASKAKRRAGGR